MFEFLAQRYTSRLTIAHDDANVAGLVSILRHPRSAQRKRRAERTCERRSERIGGMGIHENSRLDS